MKNLQKKMQIAATMVIVIVFSAIFVSAVENPVIAGAGTETEATEMSDTTVSKDWSAEESKMLLKIAMAEAEGETVEGKALVMLVVLNRVYNEEFPNTIEGVIFQSGQFPVVKNGGRYYTTEPNEECYEALSLVRNGWDKSQGALFFESCAVRNSWHSRNLTLLFEYGGQRFYK